MEENVHVYFFLHLFGISLHRLREDWRSLNNLLLMPKTKKKMSEKEINYLKLIGLIFTAVGSTIAAFITGKATN
jgi:hypothetical protein